MKTSAQGCSPIPATGLTLLASFFFVLLFSSSVVFVVLASPCLFSTHAPYASDWHITRGGHHRIFAHTCFTSVLYCSVSWGRNFCCETQPPMSRSGYLFNSVQQ